MKIEFEKYPNNTLKNKRIQKVINEAYESLGTAKQYPMMNGYQDGKEKPQRFSFILAMPLPFNYVNWENFLGFIIQVREKKSSFGSDSILIRTLDGNLQNWGNQSFLILPEKEVEKILPFFQESLEEEKNYIEEGGTYTVEGKDPRNEYIVKTSLDNKNNFIDHIKNKEGK